MVDSGRVHSHTAQWHEQKQGVNRNPQSTAACDDGDWPHPTGQTLNCRTLPHQFACDIAPDPSAFLSPIRGQRATRSGHKGTSRRKAPGARLRRQAMRLRRTAAQLRGLTASVRLVSQLFRQ
jgi:hypothetical protein